MTADRPELVGECISSYLTDRSAPSGVLLSDDSRGVVNSAAVRSAAVTGESAFGVTFRYMGRSDRRGFITRLSRAGIPDSIAAFCLLGAEHAWVTTGASRNAALLDSLGEEILMVDDDTLGRTAVYPDAGRDIQLAGHADPTDIRFFSSREAAMAAAEWTHVELFGETSRFLGAELSQLTLRSGDSCQHLLLRLHDGSGIVRAVSYGVVGDSGFYSPLHLLWMTSAATRERIRLSEANLETALSSREVIRMVSQPAITHGTVCMAAAIGLDNRRMLPPFLPIGRNQDGFFGNLLLRCFPEACTLQMPCAVVHRPPEGRGYGRLAHEPQTLRLSELMILLLSACPVGPDVSSAKTFRILGEHLKDISKSSGQFILYAREIVRSVRGSLLESIGNQWGDFAGFSPLWTRQASQFQARLQELIASPDCWQPQEMQGESDDSITGETRRIVALTGEMLASWPGIVEAARYLQTKNIRISRLAGNPNSG